MAGLFLLQARLWDGYTGPTLQLEMVIDNGHRDIDRLSFHSFFHSSNSAARCSLSNANLAPKSLPQRQHFKLLFR